MKEICCHRFMLSVLLLLLAFTAYGQEATLSGQVSTVEGEPLALASITLEGTPLGANADSEGNFMIPKIPAGTYQVKVSFVGFASITETIVLETGQNLERNFSLQEDMLNLEGVVISGTRYKYDRTNAPIVVNVVDNKLLNATQSIAISEGLNFQPGVRVETNCQNCGFTQVRLNGLEGAYSQILINSRPIFSALNSVYGLDQIPTNIVEQIEVVRSGGSALYGSNAIGGTINIITRDPVENSWQIKANSALLAGDVLDQTYNFNGSIVSESLKSGVTFFGMSRNRDGYDANGDGFTELVQLENTVLGAKAFFKPGAHSKLSIDFSALNEYRRGGDRLDLAPHFTDITEELAHNTIFGGLTYDQWSKDDHSKFSFYTSAQNTDRRSYYGGLGGGETAADSLLAASAYGGTKDLSLIAGGQFTRYFTNNDVVTLGVENQYYNTRDEIQGYSRLVDQQVNTAGIFAQYEWKPVQRFTALLGGRYDLTQVNGLYQIGSISSTSDVNVGVFSPRVTLLYKLHKNIRFRGGYARGFRAPQAFNEDLHISSVGGEPLFVILSEDLEIETSDAFTASLNMTKNFGLAQANFLVEGFYTQLQNPFTQVSTGAVLPNGSIVEEVRNGEGATVSGVNFEAGFSPSRKVAFQLGGTAQQSRYHETQVLFEPEVSSSEEVVAVDEFVRNPNFYGYFTSFYEFSDVLKIDLTGTYTGAMVVPRVVSESGFLNLIDSTPFLDVNVKASYHVDLSEDLHLEISGGVKNMFNSYQQEFDSGPQRDSDFIYGPMAPRSVFLSLTLGNLH